MRKVFDSWVYIFKNIWYVLPTAILPAVFLALSLDYTAVKSLMTGFFTGAPRLAFHEYFRAFSMVRTDSVLGGIYSILAFFSTAVCGALLLSLAEKHMRIGKRTLSGVFRGFCDLLPFAFLALFVYTFLYELWALILSALLFAVASFSADVLVYIGFLAAVCLTSFALLYMEGIFYLWLPCRQMTGFGVYNSFLYSYRLLSGVRRSLLLSHLASFAGALLLLGGFSLLPEAVFRVVGVFVFALLFLNFAVRMVTLYFETDKLDREDILHSYREY